MKDIFRENVTLERLKAEVDQAKIQKDSSFLISYPEFLKYFRELKTIEIHNLIIGINFTYAWMPTILDYRSNEFDKSAKILNNLRQGNIPKEEEMRTLISMFNNSLVGTSKIMHFVNPEIISIWDSRVFRYLTGEEPYQYRMDNVGYFMSYLELCNEITSEIAYNDIHRKIVDQVGYEMTKKRTLELIMYLKGGK